MVSIKKIKFSSMILVCLFAAIAVFRGNGFIIGHQENQNDRSLTLIIETADKKFEQTFKASKNNLARISFAVGPYHPGDSPYLDCRLFEINAMKDSQKLTYDLISSNKKQVRHERLNGWLISDRMFNNFNFSPLTNSKNKYYLLSIRSPGLENYILPSTLLASSKESYEGGYLFVNGEKQNGDLAFRAQYKHPWRKLIQQIPVELALQKPFPFSEPQTYYLLFGIYIVLLLVFFYWL